MCENCLKLPSRRHVFMGLAAGLAGGLLPNAQARAATSPPKPENVMAPQDALARLMQGNARYVSGNTNVSRGFTPGALANGQNPYAAILGCADSRVSPELAFDENQGDLFITRVAGNYVTVPLLASLEYAVAVLKTPLIYVLGHTRCGAISAAVQAIKEDKAFPGHIQNLTTDLAPAVKAAKKSGAADLVMQATIDNVRLNVAKLAGSTPILRRAVREGRLHVAGGIYNLATGKVEPVIS